nr:ribonuclease H-like domain-containing protein [Tanacetum cinerariifolium]
MLVTMGEGSGTLTERHHTPSPKAKQTLPTTHSSPSLPPSLALPTAADEFASPLGYGSQGEACPTITGLVAGQDMINITKTSTLPSDSTPRVTSLAIDEGSMQHQIQELMALCISLQSGVAEVPTSSGSIPNAGHPATGVPTSSDITPRVFGSLTTDKSSASETYDFASCVSSPKTNDSFSTVDVKILPMSDVKDPSPTNGFPSCSFKENVKPPRNLCNKSGKADRIYCKNNFVSTKKCFVCGSKSHLIKDCDVYDTVDNFPSVISKASSVPAGRRNSSASTSAGRPIPAASRNRPTSIHAGRHIPVDRCNKPAPFLAGRSVPPGWTNHAARPFFKPTNLYFNNVNPHVNKDIAIVDSGCSRSMTGNKEKLDDFVQIKGGTVTFGGGDSKITGKGTIKTSKLNFENVYYVKELQHFNLFSVSQICDRKNKVLFTDGMIFTLSTSQTYNQSKQINCLLAKASLEESTKWHRRMANVNFKTINKLAKHGLVEGLPLKLFTNEHNCVACNKGKQHKASYKAIFAGRTISEPLKLLHMDLYGPTSIRSIDHKYYSLVVTDDFSRTPQQNGVAKRKNRTLIEAARSMLADSKLPTMFWTEAVSTACYVLNRVSITNPQNKTPYELLSGKVPNIWHLKPFGCQVTILNTSEHLRKFEGKANDGFLVGYAAHSKAYRVYNLSSKKVEETLNLRYLEDKPNVQGLGQEWYFDLDYLTDSLGYTRFKTTPPAGTQAPNIIAGTQDDDSESECDEQAILVPSFPSNSFSGSKVNDVSAPMETNLDYVQKQEYEAHSAAAKYGFDFSNGTAEMLHQADIETRRNLVLAAGDPAGSIVSTGGVPAGSIPAGSVPATSNVVVDPVATKRVNTIHPQSQIIGDLQSQYRHGVQLVVTKDETFYILKDFIALIENQLNKKVKAIRCDNGTKFQNAKLIDLCGDQGIKRDYSNLRTPQQNRVVERKNRTLIAAARSMLADSKLPTMFWTEAVSTTCYVLNRVSITNPHNKTPYELLSGKVPNIWHLKPFGCQVTILNTSDHLGKFDGKANDGFLVGYAAHSKAYKVYNLSSKKVEETFNLRYLEDKPNVQGLAQEWYFDLDYLTDSLESECDEQAILVPSFPSNSFSGSKVNDVSAPMETNLDYVQKQEYEAHSAAAKTNPPAGTHDTNILAGTQADDSESEYDEQVILVPSFPSNSFSGPMVHDVSAPMENNLDYAAELVRLQTLLPQAEIKIHKNLVSAAGDPAGSVVPTGGVPASSVPASGVPAGSVPASGVLAGSIASTGRVPAGGVPASGVPAGSVPAGGVLAGSIISAEFDPHNPKHVYRVVKALYGLHQAPRAWYARLSTFLLKHHYRRGTIDKTLFLKKDSRHIILVQVYVDDIIFGSTNKAWCDEFEVLMKGEFEMSAMGELMFFLGLQVKQLPDGIFISQDKYVKDMLKKFDMESMRTATTPYEVSTHKSKDDTDTAVNVYLFRSMIGSLMYLTASRPDIMFAVSACSRHQVTPVREPTLVKDPTHVRDHTPVRDPTPVREPTPSPMREPTSDSPRPFSPPPRIEEVGPTTSTRPPSLTRHTSAHEAISKGGGDFVSSP